MSYAWAELRRRLEARYATGTPPLHSHHLGHPTCPTRTAHTPSHRTLQRRHAQHRWLTQPP